MSARFKTNFELFDRPIPGQGLTSNPDSPPPWRTPPTYANADAAYRAIMQKVTSQKTLPKVMQLFRDDASISMVVRNLLMGMFVEGHITHAMILKLAQPLMQSLYVLCMQAGIEPKISHIKSAKQKQQAQIEALRMAEELDITRTGDLLAEEPMEMPEAAEEPATEETPKSLLGGM